jgi:hypothetical protein
MPDGERAGVDSIHAHMTKNPAEAGFFARNDSDQAAAAAATGMTFATRRLRSPLTTNFT